MEREGAVLSYTREAQLGSRSTVAPQVRIHRVEKTRVIAQFLS